MTQIGFPSDHDLTRACEGKSRYRTEQIARDYASRTLRKGKGRAERLFPYACTVCRRWHLTKSPTGLVGATRKERWEGVAA